MAEVTVGWDLGGAHVKACRLEGGLVRDVVQWPCALWQGLDKLAAVLDLAHARWPDLAQARQVLTMTGEMVDLFSSRQQGVDQLARFMADRLAPLQPLQVFAGPGQWCDAADAASRWADIASANWLATAHAAAGVVGNGLLVDIGTTTTDLLVLRAGQVALTGRSDAQRLASGELVYQGVVRTPLCALGQRLPWQGQQLNVMNEWFATSADVHRLTSELAAAHDQQPAADGGAKTPEATRTRLARMIGLDAGDGTPAQWLDLARHWRGVQVADIAGQLQRVLEGRPLPAGARVVSAGCGSFLVPAVLASAGLVQHPVLAFGRDVAALHAQAAPDTADWAQVCAPAVAVAQLWFQEQG